ncbi:RNA polymerase II mediator complex subunit [Oleoguttula sp. CCFEE 5521]
MLTRPPVSSTTRPPLPTRSVTIGQQYPHTQQLRRPALPSRLSSVRSASGPSQHVNFDQFDSARRNDVAKKENSSLGHVESGEDGAEEGRPWKKAKIEPEEVMVSSPTDQDDEVQTITPDEARVLLPGDPMSLPPRPQPARRKPTPKNRLNYDPLRKATGLQPPAIATRLPSSKRIADFSPWSGTHPEDVLNETIIKGGYYDKPPNPSQNETNSARHSIWPNLSQKNNVALHTLSHLFTQVLEKRAAMGRITAPSSFKLPPRVTVTDTKREAWLKDLANLAIPLRRQSRTIPHGIRGKGLLEQCLAKEMPLSRAIWLAKCVGANELRAFRRKGVSGTAGSHGEAKWLRDWTVGVQQFFEGVAAECGKDAWRKKIDYAIKLTSSLYIEGLIEREEYLDWVVRMFGTAEEKSLPLWVIIAQIYWKELVKSGCRGRKLGAATFKHLHALDLKTAAAYVALKDRLRKLIAILAVTERGCLIVPGVWDKYKYLLEPVEKALPAHLRSAITSVMERNERLAVPMTRTFGNTRSPMLSLVDLLDAVELSVRFCDLTTQCLALFPNTDDLVSGLLRWASSPFRIGDARVYIAAGIVEQLYRAGHDTNSAILDYLRTEVEITPAETSNVGMLMAQLVQRDCFVVGKYMQWLITNGATSTGVPPRPAAVVLTALPTEKIPRHLSSLRDALLARIGLAVQESAAIDSVQESIWADLQKGSTKYIDPSGILQSLSTSAQSTLATALVQQVALRAKHDGITDTSFCLVRGVLEQAHQYVAITALIAATTTTDDLAALASAADTLATHALVIAALGQLTSLFKAIYAQHIQLRTHREFNRNFLLALLRLAVRLPGLDPGIPRLLKNDLILCDQRSNAAACSPASDNLVSIIAEQLEGDDQIDAVFASGNTMDEATFKRVFLRVMARADGVESGEGSAQSRLCGWVEQLRVIDATELEKVGKEHVDMVMRKNEDSASASPAIMALIASGCLTIDSIFPTTGATEWPGLAVSWLRFLAEPLFHSAFTTDELYTIDLQRQQFLEERREMFSQLMRSVADHEIFQIDSEWVIQLCLNLGASPKDKDGSPDDWIMPERLSSAILQRKRPHVAALDPCEVVHTAGALNIAVSATWLRARVIRLGNSASAAETRHALLEAFRSNSEVWPQLLSAASPQMLRSIHESAVDLVLLAATNSSHDYDEATTEMTDRCCKLMDLTYPAARDEAGTNVLTTVLERVKIIATALGAPEHVSQRQLLTSLHTLLQVLALYSSSTPESSNAQACTQVAAVLLDLLAGTLAPQGLRLPPQTMDRVHDVAALYTDNLSMADLGSLGKALPVPLAKSHYLASLLPDLRPQDASLALATRVPASRPPRALPSSGAARPPAPVRPRPPFPQPGSAAPSDPSQPRQSAQQSQLPSEMKYAPFQVKRWEVLPDATPTVGENDCSIGLGMFGARRV